jgi:hypothetical protein
MKLFILMVNLNSLTKYEELKFAIRCVNVYKCLKPSDDELNKVIGQDIV